MVMEPRSAATLRMLMTTAKMVPTSRLNRAVSSPRKGYQQRNDSSVSGQISHDRYSGESIRDGCAGSARIASRVADRCADLKFIPQA